jgi:hypothetical protein
MGSVSVTVTMGTEYRSNSNCLAFKYLIYGIISHHFSFQGYYKTQVGGRDSVVDKVTRYGLDGLGIEFWWGRNFPFPSRLAPKAHVASCTMCTASLLEVKQPRRGGHHPPPLTAEVANGLQLQLRLPSVPE